MFIHLHYLILSHRTFSQLLFCLFFFQRAVFESSALILFFTHSEKGHNSISLPSCGTAAFKKWLYTLSWQPKDGKRGINLTERPGIKNKEGKVEGAKKGLGWGGWQVTQLVNVGVLKKLYTNSRTHDVGVHKRTHTYAHKWTVCVWGCRGWWREGEGAGINPYLGLICIALGCCRRRVFGDFMKSCQHDVIPIGASPGKQGHCIGC